MDSELTNIAAVKALNQGVATTDSPSFAGLTATTADINGGTIDGTTIGATTPGAGTFSALTVNAGTSQTAVFSELTTNSSFITVNSQFGVGRFGTFNNYPAILYDATNYAYHYDSNNSISYLAGDVHLANAAGPSLLNEAAASTNPTLVPNRADPDTGIGWQSADIGALVAGGANVLNWNSSGNVGIGVNPTRFFQVQRTGVNDTVVAMIGGGSGSGGASVGIGASGSLAYLEAFDNAFTAYRDLVFGGAQTYFRASGTTQFRLDVGSLFAENAAGPALLNEAATSTNPTVAHNRADPTTGWGGVSGIIDAVVSGARIGSFDGGGYVARQQGSAAAPSIQLNEDSTGLFTLGAGAGVGISLAGTEGVRAQAEGVSVIDGVTAPSTVTGRAIIYVDSADGDLKVKFADGHTAVVADGAVQLQETGTWTPVVAGQTTAGTQTYSNQVGTYVRVGDMVTATFEFSMTAKDAATAGNVRITGLPFAANSTSTISVAAAVASYDGVDIDVAGGRYQVGAFIQAATSFLRVFESGDNVATASIVATDIGATFSMRGSVTYWRA